MARITYTDCDCRGAQNTDTPRPGRRTTGSLKSQLQAERAMTNNQWLEELSRERRAARSKDATEQFLRYD